MTEVTQVDMERAAVMRGFDSYEELVETGLVSDKDDADFDAIHLARRREAAVAEKDAEILRLKAAIQRQASAVRSLRLCEDTEINILRSKSRDAHAAVATLDSEREANSILTDENTTLRAKLEEARGLLGEWAQWLEACNEGGDCEYLNGSAWDDADAIAGRTGAFLSGEARS